MKISDLLEMNNFVSCELYLRDYLVKYAKEEKLGQFFDKYELLLHRFNIPFLRRGIHSLKIFEKLSDSLILYCEVLVTDESKRYTYLKKMNRIGLVDIDS